MPDYSTQSFEKISQILAQLSIQHGATAYSLQNDIIPLDIAMDAVGPMTWALTLHADVMARLANISSGGVNLLPVTCVQNADTPYGNQAMLQSGKIPISMTLNFLDAALEHCISLGIREMGYTAEEWLALEPGYQVIPIEPYFMDLKTNWVTTVMEGNDLGAILNAWPRLFEVELLVAPSDDLNADPEASTPISFPSMRLR